MRVHPRLLSPWLFLVLAACPVGTTSSGFGPARGPAGVETQVQVEGRRDPLIGELLAVRDTGLVVLVQRRVTLVPFSVMRSAAFSQIGTAWVDRSRPDPVLHERVRMVSRFPQGLNPDLERALLAAYGQSAMDVITQ